MKFDSIFLVIAGGGCGAIARYIISRWFLWRYPDEKLPLGTLFVNLLGSFLLGILVGSHLNQTWLLFAGTGFMGSFTTFSTFKLENMQFKRNGDIMTMFLYLFISYVPGIALAYCGLLLGQTL